MFNWNDPPKNPEGKIELCVLLSVNWLYYAALKVCGIKGGLFIKISLGH